MGSSVPYAEDSTGLEPTYPAVSGTEARAWKGNQPRERQGQKTTAAMAQPIRWTTCSLRATCTSLIGSSRIAMASSTIRRTAASACAAVPACSYSMMTPYCPREKPSPRAATILSPGVLLAMRAYTAGTNVPGINVGTGTTVTSAGKMLLTRRKFRFAIPASMSARSKAVSSVRPSLLPLTTETARGRSHIQETPPVLTTASRAQLDADTRRIGFLGGAGGTRSRGRQRLFHPASSAPPPPAVLHERACG